MKLSQRSSFTTTLFNRSQCQALGSPYPHRESCSSRCNHGCGLVTPPKVSSCVRGDLYLVLGNISSWKGLSIPGTAAQSRGESPNPEGV